MKVFLKTWERQKTPWGCSCFSIVVCTLDVHGNPGNGKLCHFFQLSVPPTHSSLRSWAEHSRLGKENDTSRPNPWWKPYTNVPQRGRWGYGQSGRGQYHFADNNGGIAEWRTDIKQSSRGIFHGSLVQSNVFYWFGLVHTTLGELRLSIRDK